MPLYRHEADRVASRELRHRLVLEEHDGTDVAPGRVREGLGGGKRIFADDGRAHPLQLVSARTTGTGVQLCVVRPSPGM